MNPKVIELRIYPDENGKLAIPSEYRSDVTYGANVRALAVSLYSEGVMSNDRIAAFLNAASENTLELSEGSVYSFCRKLAENALYHFGTEHAECNVHLLRYLRKIRKKQRINGLKKCLIL